MPDSSEWMNIYLAWWCIWKHLVGHMISTSPCWWNFLCFLNSFTFSMHFIWGWKTFLFFMHCQVGCLGAFLLLPVIPESNYSCIADLERQDVTSWMNLNMLFLAWWGIWLSHDLNSPMMSKLTGFFSEHYLRKVRQPRTPYIHSHLVFFRHYPAFQLGGNCSFRRKPMRNSEKTCSLRKPTQNTGLNPGGCLRWKYHPIRFPSIRYFVCLTVLYSGCLQKKSMFYVR